MSRRSQSIGIYQRDEIPEPLEYQFLDHDGTPLDLTGFTAEWWTSINGVDTEHPASVTNAAEGRVVAPWTAAMTADPGRMSHGVFWVTDGAHTHASDTLRWSVVDGPGPN